MKYTVQDQKTLHEALSQFYPDCSNSTFRKWLKFERILLNGKSTKILSKPVSSGDTVEILTGKKREEFPCKILFEDAHLIAIDKPPGLLSVDTEKGGEPSVHAMIKKRYPEINVIPAHRLDKGTSGVLLFSLGTEALRGIKPQFKKHSIERCYHALVEGVLEEEEGTWDSPLYEDRNLFVRKARPGTGMTAITHYKVLKRTENQTLIECHLETGKKNQIRVHAQIAGHPVVGDEKYGAETNPLKRLALHATTLGFTHPITEEEIALHSEAPFV